VVLLCFCTIVIAICLRCSTICLTGTVVSVPSGQVNSVWIAIETIGFWLRCDVTVVVPETTEAAVRLDEVFIDCSERAAFLAPITCLAPLLSVAPVFPVSIWGILVKKQHVCPKEFHFHLAPQAQLTFVGMSGMLLDLIRISEGADWTLAATSALPSKLKFGAKVVF